MKKTGAFTIRFETDKEISIEIGKKYDATSKDKKLVINAPNATIVNKADFKVVTIINAKSYAEAGKENTLYVKDPDAEIIVAKKASVKKITFLTKSANLELRDKSNVGKIVFKEKNAKVTVSAGENAEADITLSKKTTLSLTGSQNSDIDISVDAAKSTVYAHIPAEIDVEKNSKIVLREGSEGETAGYTLVISNKNILLD